jgi:predicted amidohydrolase YtcJ
MTIVPGFIDCHNHAPGEMLLYEVVVGNPYEVEFVSIASIIEKLRAKARQAQAGFWVEGQLYDDTKVRDKRQLNIHDLDQVSTEHPVSVTHRGGHTSFYNSNSRASRRIHAIPLVARLIAAQAESSQGAFPTMHEMSSRKWGSEQSSRRPSKRNATVTGRPTCPSNSSVTA